MSDITIYHNPKCSKSRQTLDLLQSNNITPTIIEYLNAMPTPAELKSIVSKLGVKAESIIRKKEDLFKELAPKLASEGEAINLICENPKLLERPIVVRGERAVIGRPPENVLALLQD